MLSDIITGLVRTQDDMVVVGVVEPGVNLLAALWAARPDIVILGLDDASAGPVSQRLLSLWPDLKVMGVSADGRSGCLYELRPHRVPLGDLSAHGLVEAIRQRARANWTAPSGTSNGAPRGFGAGEP